jgi:hypothetical protein
MLLGVLFASATHNPRQEAKGEHYHPLGHPRSNSLRSTCAPERGEPDPRRRTRCGSAFNHAMTARLASSMASALRRPLSNKPHTILRDFAALLRKASRAFLRWRRVKVADVAMLAAVRKTEMIRSVRAFDGVSQPSTALAFSAALRSSSILELLLALAVPISPPLCPNCDQAQRLSSITGPKTGCRIRRKQ